MKWLIKYLPANPSTITGRMLGIATVTAVLAVVDSSLIPLLSQLIWLVVVAFVCGLLFRPKLEFQLTSTQMLVNGQSSEITFLVTNAGNYQAYDVQLSFPFSDFGLMFDAQPSPISELAAHDQVLISFKVQATARGEHRLPTIYVSSNFPFGMFRFISKQRTETQLAVAPQYHLETYEEMLSSGADSSFDQQSSRRERALEYIGSREYREGLQVRRWDFAAWARLGIPTIREFNKAHEPTALILIDAFQKFRGKPDDDLELLLSKSATAAMSLDRSGYRVILVVVAENTEVIDGHGDGDQADLILRSLAKVNGCTRQPMWWDVWDTVQATIERDWTLLFFLRSDQSVNPLTDSDLIFDAKLDWTPERPVDTLQVKKLLSIECSTTVVTESAADR